MIDTPLPAGAGSPTRIGLIADTHVHSGHVPYPAGLEKAFRDVDLIVHLGDMGEASVLDRLAEIAPTLATRGGDDPPDDARIADARLLVGAHVAVAAAFELGALIAAARSESMQLPEGDLAELLRRTHGRPIGAVAFAGTHAPACFARDGVVFVNPGSATLPASGPRSVAILELHADAPRASIVAL